MDHQELRAALAETRSVLTPQLGLDWGVPAGPLEWSCRDTLAHIGHDLLAYAGQLAARPTDRYLPFDLTVRQDTGPADLLATALACGDLLALALAAADPGLRAWHWGPTDPSGFAAMGVAETLLHTHDITTGLALDWTPPPALCAAVLARLFPDAPAGEPAPVLLWCTGRGELPGRSRRESWAWRAALAE
ncbi:maleylpyruvate isomerase N-terminal domain-containing protein [Kitasatospora fiedleri]|uniref:maleylpyruvate isomerase N-terminal domain-containing protein n=1 Tax=Kitasatospora fiedleri TaxID=2991545 RepID=UPI00249A665C|nr:maleylpyruvate isomerase N-terminal domain-containing protein [Kitasatospora fiedleri]